MDFRAKNAFSCYQLIFDFSREKHQDNILWVANFLNVLNFPAKINSRDFLTRKFKWDFHTLLVFLLKVLNSNESQSNLNMKILACACNDKEATSHCLKNPKKMSHLNFRAKNQQILTFLIFAPKIKNWYFALKIVQNETFLNHFQPLCNIMSHG